MWFFSPSSLLPSLTAIVSVHFLEAQSTINYVFFFLFPLFGEAGKLEWARVGKNSLLPGGTDFFIALW